MKCKYMLDIISDCRGYKLFTLNFSNTTTCITTAHHERFGITTDVLVSKLTHSLKKIIKEEKPTHVQNLTVGSKKKICITCENYLILLSSSPLYGGREMLDMITEM